MLRVGGRATGGLPGPVGPLTDRLQTCRTTADRPGEGVERCILEATSAVNPSGHFPLTPTLSRGDVGSVDRGLFCGRGGTRAAEPRG